MKILWCISDFPQTILSVYNVSDDCTLDQISSIVIPDLPGSCVGVSTSTSDVYRAFLRCETPDQMFHFTLQALSIGEGVGELEIIVGPILASKFIWSDPNLISWDATTLSLHPFNGTAVLTPISFSRVIE